MAKPSWQRPDSPIGRKGPRKANPRYKRNAGESWTDADIQKLGTLARDNTPTRVIGLKLGRTEASVRSKARSENISLSPANRSPYNRRRSRRA